MRWITKGMSKWWSKYNWNKWYAWYPVCQINETDGTKGWFWLEYVERKIDDYGEDWEYRPL